MRAYKVTLLVIDFDQLGPDDIVTEIENVNFPNDCVRPEVVEIVGKDIGEWNDDHPLNRPATTPAEFARLFGDGEEHGD